MGPNKELHRRRSSPGVAPGKGGSLVAPGVRWREPRGEATLAPCTPTCAAVPPRQPQLQPHLSMWRPWDVWAPQAQGPIEVLSPLPARQTRGRWEAPQPVFTARTRLSPCVRCHVVSGPWPPSCPPGVQHASGRNRLCPGTTCTPALTPSVRPAGASQMSPWRCTQPSCLYHKGHSTSMATPAPPALRVPMPQASPRTSRCGRLVCVHPLQGRPGSVLP